MKGSIFTLRAGGGIDQGHDCGQFKIVTYL